MFGPKLSGPPENPDYRRTTGLTSWATKMTDPTRLRPVIFMRYFAKINIQISLKIADCMGDFLVFSVSINVGNTGQAMHCLLTS
jgi:hypothetical protein